MQLDLSRSVPSANKLARTTNLLMITESATNAQSTKLSQTESAHAEPITSEPTALESANLHAQPLNSSIKEDVLNAHSTSNTELKSKDAPVLMVFTSTITESVKRFQLFQSHVMLVLSSTPQRDALSVQQDAKHAQAPQFVPLVLKTDLVSSVEHARQFAVMELLPELNNVMIRTVLLTRAVLLLVQLSPCSLAQVSHQFVFTMVQPFAEMVVLKLVKVVMMETSSMEMVAATDAKRKHLPTLTQQVQTAQPQFLRA